MNYLYILKNNNIRIAKKDVISHLNDWRNVYTKP